MVVTQQPRIKTHWAPCGRRENRQDYYVVRQAGGSGDYWEPHADPDGNIRDRFSEPERLQWVADNREMLDWINCQKPTSILDIGAGPGWLLREIKGGIRGAVETSELAREKLDALDVLVFDELADIASASFEIVVMHHVIEHLVDPLYAINHVHRILHKGGWLVLGTPDFGCPCAVRFGDRYRMLHDPTHVSLFTLESCSRMLRDYGFTIERMEFPFPGRYATAETMARWCDTSQVSPPWPGNWMTFYCRNGG